MVLKFGSEPDEVFFVEATSNMGVALKRYSGMKHTIGDFYKKIVIRHLDWERPDSSLDVLEQFIDEVNGLKYKFSLNQLKRRQTVNLDMVPGAVANANEDPNSNEAKAKMIEDGRAFFCSELVAKAYKCCGIMKRTNEACSNFLPGDMASAKNKLDLVNGASLAPE